MYCHILVILPANNMITQLRKLWILYYIQYLLVIAHLLSDRYITTDPVWSYHFDQLKHAVVVNFFVTSTTVILNHFAEGNQIQTYDVVREPH